jgi:uncharacterized protein YqeY
MAEAQTFTQLKADMKEAMKAKQADRLSTIRMLISSLKNKQIDVGHDLSEKEITSVLATEAKKRREAAESYRSGGRDELADKEEAELLVIEGYLPKQLSEDEVADIVDQLIAQTGASTKSDMGKIMGPLMGRIKGQFDGSKAKNIVLSKLA